MKRITAKIFLCILVGSLRVFLLSAAQTNPLERIVSLLTKLQAHVVKDGEMEEMAFKKYKEYCQNTLLQKSQDLKSSEAQKQSLEAASLEASSAIQASRNGIEEASTSIAENDSQLKKASGIREADAATFKDSEKELIRANGMLEKAVTMLQKEIAKTNSTSLFQSSETQEQLQNVTMSLGAVVDRWTLGASEDMKNLKKLVVTLHIQPDDSSGESGNATDPHLYTGQVVNFIQVLEDLREKAQDRLNEIRKAEAEAVQNFELVKQSITDDTALYQKELDDQRNAQAEAEKTKAAAGSKIAKIKADLARASQDYTKLQHNFMRKAADHEATVTGRFKELATLMRAKNIIQDDMSGAADLQDDISGVASFLQLAPKSHTGSSRVQLFGEQVVQFMQQLAFKFNSTSLKQSASYVANVIKFGGEGSSEDPSSKIRAFLLELISKMEREQMADMKEGEYCEREAKRTASEQSELEDEDAKLKSDIDQAASALDELRREIKALHADLATLLRLSNDMTAARLIDRKAFLKDHADMQAGLKSIRASTYVLRDFYAVAKGDVSFLQVQSEGAESESDSDMQGDDRPTPPEKFEKASSAGMGIISLLELVESDLSKNLAQLEAEEKNLQHDFESEWREYKVAMTAKEQDIKLKTKEFKTIDKRMSELSSDQALAREELAVANHIFAKLKNRCAAKPNSYAARKLKRDSETQGLREALSILESERGIFFKKSRK